MPFIKYRSRGATETNIVKATSSSEAFDKILQLKTLQFIDLSNIASSQNRVGSIGWEICLASDVLRVHKQTLAILNLEGNDMGARGVMKLTELMDRECVLEEIYLGRNCLGLVGCGPLSDALKTQLFLRCVSIPSNGIGDRGATVMSFALLGMQSCSLETLDVADNEIGEKGAEAITSALQRFNGTIKKINLEGNDIGSRGAMRLADVIEESDHLEELYLGRNNIGTAGAASLADALRHDAEIRILNLSSNNIGDHGTVVLVNALHRHEKISELDLFKNDIGRDGVASIATLLITNRSLRSINIAANQHISENNGGQRLACALETTENRFLTYFHVYARDVGRDGDAYHRIKSIIRRNREEEEMMMAAANDDLEAETEVREENGHSGESEGIGISDEGASSINEMANQPLTEGGQIENLYPVDDASSLSEDSAFRNGLVQPSAPPASVTSGSFLLVGHDGANVESVPPIAPPLMSNGSSSNRPGESLSPGQNTSTAKLSSPPPKSNNEMDCKICYDNIMDCVLLPCSHMCCCLKCSKGMIDCPICRSVIAKALPIYKV